MDLQNKSCFFLDTKTRSNHYINSIKNRTFMLLKSILLFLSLILYCYRLATYRFYTQQILSMICGIMFISRVFFQMFFFWNRIININELIVESGIIIPLSLLSLGYLFRIHYTWAIFHFSIFLIGSLVNFYSEYDRMIFKKNNPNKFYDQKLYKYCRHPNYMGEILSFIGWAGLSGNFINHLIPCLMSIGMIKYSIPELDFYLEKKYSIKYLKYKDTIKYKLIPLIY